ncbi:MAG TPA: amylo-alpha-1,6-glucosidase [Bacteroidota bacterium]|nr:amylo-alpha-1,6-glucosidase [Bacteroidota bacterium]
MKNLLFLLFVLLMGCSPSSKEQSPITMDELVVEVHGESREVGYTNKQAGFYYTESNGEHRTAWQGWHVMSTKILDDYALLFDEKHLKKSDAQLAFVYPHQLLRTYKIGILERVTLLDSVDALIVELSNIKAKSLSVLPLFSGSDSSEFVIRSENGSLLIARHNHLRRTPEKNYPVWIGVMIADGSARPEVRLNPTYINTSISPASVRSLLSSSQTTVIFAAGDTEAATTALLHRLSREFPDFVAQRKQRMESTVNRSFVRTDSERFDKALHWAMLSMDALIMNQVKKGIFAGLPWFANYWGRDSFISLPGATLVTGNFADAKEILRSFAEWQERDPKSPNEGRIPNLVTPFSISYNTADGTPWFVSALYDYARYTNDTTFMREMYPVVKRSIEGTLKHRVDRNVFVTHGDAETWMDAVGPNGPWSPRGNRANDIQALWYKQLRLGSVLAAFVGEIENANRWSELAEKVAISFDAHFLDHASGFVYDHLNADGTRDSSFRPNQLFTFGLLRNPLHRYSMFKGATEKLVYEHGVASLWQGDENFHPFHEYPPYYPKDAAYHNGIVWTWLAGTWIDQATYYGQSQLAFRVTNNMVHQILDRGAVGTISELVEAAPRPGEKEPRLSGTFSQAWSLAEFIRTAYQAYLGIYVDGSIPRVVLTPRLPSVIDRATVRVGVRNFFLRIRYRISDGILIIESPSDAEALELRVEWPLADGNQQHFDVGIKPNSTSTFTIENRSVHQEVGGTKQPVRSTFVGNADLALSFGPVSLATPELRENLKALGGPGHPLLQNDRIMQTNDQARLVVEMNDPVGDDKGLSGSYLYPQTPNLKPGSLDITGFRVKTDEENVYFRMEFRNLSNPGWHPEYGFQLTYAAIAIDKDGIKNSGQRTVGRNANISLPSNLGYETIIYVGGGVRIEDAKGVILAEYIPIPDDVKRPLGDVRKKTIEFALPVAVLGEPDDTWRFFVYVGAQDDHGGAGLGDFRSVSSRAGEWVGGGKRRPSDPNIYDVIVGK